MKKEADKHTEKDKEKARLLLLSIRLQLSYGAK
jgi:hypothetical protein